MRSTGCSLTLGVVLPPLLCNAHETFFHSALSKKSIFINCLLWFAHRNRSACNVCSGTRSLLVSARKFCAIPKPVRQPARAQVASFLNLLAFCAIDCKATQFCDVFATFLLLVTTGGREERSEATRRLQVQHLTCTQAPHILFSFAFSRDYRCRFRQSVSTGNACVDHKQLPWTITTIDQLI